MGSRLFFFNVTVSKITVSSNFYAPVIEFIKEKPYSMLKHSSL